MERLPTVSKKEEKTETDMLPICFDIDNIAYLIEKDYRDAMRYLEKLADMDDFSCSLEKYFDIYKDPDAQDELKIYLYKKIRYIKSELYSILDSR